MYNVYNVTMRCVGVTTIIITYSERMFVALVIQHAKRMRRIIFHFWPAPFYNILSTFSHKRHDFREKEKY